MNTKHLFTASLIGGLTSLALANAPYLNLICAGFWIGPIVAVWLYRRLDGSLTLRQAILTGILAGTWHALFGLLFSLLGLAGAGGLLKEVQPFVSAQDWSEVETNLTGVGGILFNLFGAGVDIVFGFLGGLIGNVIFGVRRTTAQ